MGRLDAADLAIRLGRRAEAVCRHYLGNGHREGRYWRVGDARNTPGRSMFVRLAGGESGKGAAGRWMDAATAEYGDLLDVIRESCGLAAFKDVAEEARCFLALPPLPAEFWAPKRITTPAPSGSSEAARRLFAAARPIAGTVAEAYMRRRGLTLPREDAALRFHPRCYHRVDGRGQPETWPAMIAAVTDREGRLTGVHRTWLARDGSGKAAVATPRRAMGELLGHAVRFGAPRDVMAAGEGIETVLSLRQVLPGLPMVAALSAAHLAAVLLPDALRRLYIVRDDDPAGDAARDGLLDRARAAGIEAVVLSPALGDFNDDLRGVGVGALRAEVRVQLAPEDVARFMAPEGT